MRPFSPSLAGSHLGFVLILDSLLTLAYPPTTNQRMPKTPPMIYVLVDRYYEEPNQTWARTSLWKNFLDLLDHDPPHNLTEISISEMKRKEVAVRIDNADIVVINWDAANGDYVCGSDDVFSYFQTQQSRKNALLRRSGKLVCEFQSSKGVLYQGSYDAIFGDGEVVVKEAEFSRDILLREDENYQSPEFKERRIREEEKWTNTKVYANRWFRLFHPLTRGLPLVLESTYADARSLFNFDNTDQEGFFWYRHRDSAFNGWFCNWRKGWIPILLADIKDPEKYATEPISGYKKMLTRFLSWLTPPRAVLLARYQGGGLMLASTMWMAIPGMQSLIKRIVEVDPDKVKKAQLAYTVWRWVTDISWGVFVGFVFWRCVSRLHIPRTQITVKEDLGLIWASLIGFRLWLFLFFKRPYGGNVLRFARHGLWAFWDTL